MTPEPPLAPPPAPPRRPLLDRPAVTGLIGGAERGAAQHRSEGAHDPAQPGAATGEAWTAPSR